MNGIIMFIVWTVVIALFVVLGIKFSDYSMSGQRYKMDNVRIEWQ